MICSYDFEVLVTLVLLSEVLQTNCSSFYLFLFITFVVYVCLLTPSFHFQFCNDILIVMSYSYPLNALIFTGLHTYPHPHTLYHLITFHLFDALWTSHSLLSLFIYSHSQPYYTLMYEYIQLSLDYFHKGLILWVFKKKK